MLVMGTQQSEPEIAPLNGQTDQGQEPVGPAQLSRDAGSHRVEISARLLLVAAAAFLIVSPWFPYWRMKLSAPQYPKGLYLLVYPSAVLGDVREIDGLNHYIGMRKINDAATLERRIGIPGIACLSALLVAASLWPSRWAVLLVVPAILFPPLFFADLYWWLRDSGLHLDPKAALSSSIKPFVPQVLGAGKIAQFRTEAALGLGFYMSLFAVGASLYYGYARLRPRRRRRPMKLHRGERVPGGVLRGLAQGAIPWVGHSCPTWTDKNVCPTAQLILRMRLAAGGVLGVALLGHPIAAGTLAVEPGAPSRALADALAKAGDGDTIVVKGGIHQGPLVVRRSVRLVGSGRPVIDGGRRGTVVRLEAPGIELRGFVIRASGDILQREDAGVVAAAPDQRIEENSFEGVLFGAYLRQAPRTVLRGNDFHGKDLPLPRRGDLIRVWYSDGVTIEGNTTSGGRDAVLWYSNQLTVRNNRISGGRYGLHFMYCHDAGISGNVLHDNSVGAFLMYSERLRLHKNWIEGNRGASGYGIGLKDMDRCEVASNVLAGNRAGIFLEHARGAFANNLLVDNDKGIVIFPSARGNRFESNTFLNNGDQVALEGFAGMMTGNLWRANFWSDYRGYDRDGDGKGDLAYRPVRLFEQLADRNPALRLFAGNPSAQAIDFASRAFPIFAPKAKFVDESPLMRPLPVPIVTAGAPDNWRWLFLGAVFLSLPAGLIVGRTSRESRASIPKNGPTSSHAETQLAGETPGGEPSRKLRPAISAAGLTKRFGKVTAVDDLSFEIGQGEAVALWGPNGAGKTTVLRCLLGLLPCRGIAHVLRAPCGPRGRASRRLLGYVAQEVRLHADLSVRETIRFYARLRKVASVRVDRLLHDWGLWDVQHRPVQQLSGGMKQKVSLVIALLADPPVLLLDEPTSNLDARARREFCSLLERLKAAGKTLLFCTHRPSEVWRLADRVIVLERGRAVAGGPPECVREHLREPSLLCLVVAAKDSSLGEARLREGGFDVERIGSRIWVDAPAGRKLEAIELLSRSGVRVLDFDLESDCRKASAPEQE
jgi:nitrous oxidase accessory protein